MVGPQLVFYVKLYVSHKNILRETAAVAYVNSTGGDYATANRAKSQCLRHA